MLEKCKSCQHYLKKKNSMFASKYLPLINQLISKQLRNDNINVNINVHKLIY